MKTRRHLESHHNQSHRPCCTLIRTFQANDFEIRGIRGVLGYKTIKDWKYKDESIDKNPLFPKRTIDDTPSAVRLYEATMLSPPELRNARVILKEFQGEAAELAINELEIYRALYASERGTNIPVVELLGEFRTDASFDKVEFREFWSNRFPNSPNAPKSNVPFLVFPLNQAKFTAVESAKSSNRELNEIPSIFRAFVLSSLDRRKQLYARSLCAQAVSALCEVHRSGIVHRSLGLSSLAVSSLDINSATSLDVRLRDFGFAKSVSSLIDGPDLERATKAGANTPAQIRNYLYALDIVALSDALLEFVWEMFDANPESIRSREIFADDMDSFRDYCLADESHKAVIKFLDEPNGERHGWKCFNAMQSAKNDFSNDFSKASLDSIIEMPFLRT